MTFGIADAEVAQSIISAEELANDLCTPAASECLTDVGTSGLRLTRERTGNVTPRHGCKLPGAGSLILQPAIKSQSMKISSPKNV
jgi:hypothetical protein